MIDTTPVTGVDTERIDRVFDQITAENLDMRYWGKKTGCGTSMCFAGHTVHEAGIPIAWYQTYYYQHNEHTGQQEKITYWKAEETEDGRDIAEVARELIGFDENQADYVFMATHITKIDELRKRVDNALSYTMLDYEDDFDADDLTV